MENPRLAPLFCENCDDRLSTNGIRLFQFFWDLKRWLTKENLPKNLAALPLLLNERNKAQLNLRRKFSPDYNPLTFATYKTIFLIEKHSRLTFTTLICSWDFYTVIDGFWWKFISNFTSKPLRFFFQSHNSHLLSVKEQFEEEWMK